MSNYQPWLEHLAKQYVLLQKMRDNVRKDYGVFALRMMEAIDDDMLELQHIAEESNQGEMFVSMVDRLHAWGA